MRIVLVNWARVWEGPHRGGGVNGYCQSLALELAGLGHDVVTICGGSVRSRFRLTAKCRVCRHPDWHGIRVFEIVDSPVKAPGAHQFDDPEGEISSPRLEAVLRDLIAWLKPDIVHFHNIEGFSAGCVTAARGASDGGARPRVLFSLHNYHPVCPEVYLTQRHRFICHDFDNGHACRVCAPQWPSRTPRRKLLSEWKRAAMILWQNEGFFRGRPMTDLRGSAPVAGEADVRGQFARSDGPTGRYKRPQISLPFFDPAQAAYRPFDNAARPEPESTKPPHPYALRRRAMIEALNSCDRVLAVSTFVRDKYAALGVEEARIERLSIGTRHAELAERARPMLPERRPMAPKGPVRMAFLGFNLPQKGLPMMLDALELLTPELLGKLELHVYARGIRSQGSRLRLLEPRLAGLRTAKGYKPEHLPFLLSGIDLGVVPSVWWDAGPQTVFEFFASGAPVLGARAGGIPDFVRDGVNGLLFRGNDRNDLARRLAEVLADPPLVDRLRRGVRPPKGMDEHASEVVEVYRSLVSSGPPGEGVKKERP